MKVIDRGKCIGAKSRINCAREFHIESVIGVSSLLVLLGFRIVDRLKDGWGSGIVVYL